MGEISIERLDARVYDLKRDLDECLQQEHRLLSDCDYEIENEHVHKHYLKLKSISNNVLALQVCIQHHMRMAQLRISYYEDRMKYIQTCQALKTE